MIQTYRNFKKSNEIFCGLELKTIIKILLILIAVSSFSLKLNLQFNSPLFLFIALITMIIIVFIVKSSQGQEAEGFYSSIITHPFANHIFNFKNKDDDYQSIEKLNSIKEIRTDYLLSKDNDLVCIIKLNNAISFHKYSSEEKQEILYSWGNFLAQFSGINNLDSYFQNLECNDSIQIFTEIKNFEPQDLNFPKTSFSNIEFSNEIHKDWYQSMFKKDFFIPDMDFYIIFKIKNPAKKNIIKNFMVKSIQKVKPEFSKISDEEQIELEQKLYKEMLSKIETLDSFLKKYNISKTLLEGKSLKDFYDRQFKLDKQWQLEDKGKYLCFEHGQKKTYTKSYRLSSLPQSGKLDFWVLEYFKIIDSHAFISIHIEPRHAIQDRRKAEAKITFNKEFNKSMKPSSLKLIKESKSLAEDLLEKPFSFDFSLYITIESEDLQEIQKLNNKIMQPVQFSRLASLDRQQVKNWLYSLAFAYNPIKNREKHFANIEFTRASYPFVKAEIGTKSGPLIGSSIETKQAIYLDEYDKTCFNNRNINFIGDSGSGKTVSAKLSLKRRLSFTERKFFIIDNTSDGWQFFVDYYGGKIIAIDQINLAPGEALFAPLACKNKDLNFKDHLESLIKLFTLMSSNQDLDSLEKNFLILSLQNLYQELEQPCLSDLYNYWAAQATDSNLVNKWLNIISPFCYAANGIFAALMDAKQSHFENERLILFTYTKIHNDANYLSTSFYLITQFISNKIQFQKETKITLIVDEAWKIFNSKNSTQGKDLLQYLARAGRGLDFGLWTISQKPNDLSNEIHSSASASLCFQLKERQDREEMVKAANLNNSEKDLLEDYLIHESGTCLLKTTRSSDLIRIKLDPLEEILCNSTREFSNQRDKIFESFRESGSEKKEAALKTVEFFLGRNINE